MNDADVAARAWDDFCDTLRAAGTAVLRAGSPGAVATRADGFAHLAQLLSLGLDFFVLNADPEQPEVTRIVTATRKWALDNPDSVYDRAPVRGTETYRLRGTRGPADLLLFDVNTGMLGSRARPRRQAGHLTSDDLNFEADGSFELWISADEHDGNWLPLDPAASPFDFGLVIRQYFAGTRDGDGAVFTIERVGEPAGGPRDAEHVARGLRESAQFVVDTVEHWGDVAEQLARTPNELVPQTDSPVGRDGANPDNAYFWGVWQLGPDQALELRCAPAPEADFWNFYVSNIWWEDVDERAHRMKVSSRDARYEPDGSLRIVLARRDPGFGNFVETAGHPEGIMLLRTTRPRSLPAVACRVIDMEAT